ncbi:hypothetical protein HDU92_009173, partial [Lobulomyces angularis]
KNKDNVTNNNNNSTIDNTNLNLTDQNDQNDEKKNDEISFSSTNLDNFLNFDWNSNKDVELFRDVVEENCFNDDDYFLPNLSNQAEIRKILSLKLLLKHKNNLHIKNLKLPNNLESTDFESCLNQFIDSNFSEIPIEQVKEQKKNNNTFNFKEKTEEEETSNLKSKKRKSNLEDEKEEEKINSKKIKCNIKKIVDEDIFDLYFDFKEVVDDHEGSNSGTFFKEYPNYTKKCLAIKNLNQKRLELKNFLNFNTRNFQLQLKRLKIKKLKNNLNNFNRNKQTFNQINEEENDIRNSINKKISNTQELESEVNSSIQQIEMLNQRFSSKFKAITEFENKFL